MADSSEVSIIHESTERDFGFHAIIAFVLLITTWLLLMPWFPGIARQTLQRFHLRTPSFAVWAVQFPVPSMYNFANQYKVEEFPPGFVMMVFDENWRYANHFPARVITFFAGRHDYLSTQTDRWFTLKSSYRGQTLESRFHLEAQTEGGYRLIRIDDVEDSL
ncbi:MAG: hypothetical protein OSA98_06550 [Rubripirellula sp.]|jgi:hypothetical protein|nr:hypothetical protein [Rubripirellula sp.]